MWDNNFEKLVAKPHNGSQGIGVHIFNESELNTIAAYSKDLFPDTQNISDIMLIQEKIESYPMKNLEHKREYGPETNKTLFGAPEFLDWNMRVLVTYDLKSGSYIPVGVICRTDIPDKPVNISISAGYISFDQAMERCGLSEEASTIRNNIEKVALDATNAIVAYCRKKYKLTDDFHFQILAGIDIILDTDKNPVVIEVNDMRSGCNYELMKLEGIEALAPIARSIIGKTALLILTRDIARQVNDRMGQEGLDLLAKGLLDVKLDDGENE